MSKQKIFLACSTDRCNRFPSLFTTSPVNIEKINCFILTLSIAVARVLLHQTIEQLINCANPAASQYKGKMKRIEQTGLEGKRKERKGGKINFKAPRRKKQSPWPSLLPWWWWWLRWQNYPSHTQKVAESSPGCCQDNLTQGRLTVNLVFFVAERFIKSAQVVEKMKCLKPVALSV